MDIQADDGDTALIWASRRGHADVVGLLLIAGQSTNKRAQSVSVNMFRVYE